MKIKEKRGQNMKKLLPLCIVGILVLSGLGAVAITNDKTNDLKIKTESIAISEPVIKDEGQYVTVSLEEAASSLLDSGKPMLPILTKVFTFPFGTKISSVDVSFSETNELALSKEVNPATEPSSSRRKGGERTDKRPSSI